jgi:hypothetical protein
MKLADKIPVEPLSAAAWDRIEAATFDAMDAADSSAGLRAARTVRRPRWPVLALGAFGIAQVAAALAFMLTRSAGGAAGKERALSSTRLVAQEEATDTLLGDVAFHLEPAAALVVAGDAASGSLVVLERGAAQFSVAKRGQRPAFVVQAGDVRVEVIGTRFRVERQADSARVDTYEGVVRVTAAGHSRLLRRGEHWLVSDGAPLPLPAAAAEADRSAPGASAVALTPLAADAKVQATRAGDDSGSPSAAATKHPKARVGQAIRAAPQLARVEEVTRDEHNRRVFEQAAALEASDPQRALHIYRSLTDQSDGWAANALYAIGRLELERGDRVAARANLQRYLAQYPRGANASDARALLARVTSTDAKREVR